MKGSSDNMTAGKELRRIKILYYAREEFAVFLSICIALCFVVAYLCRNTNVFLSSSFLNIAGGLLTGLVITVWAESGFPYELYDKLSFYTHEVEEFLKQQLICKGEIKDTLEYFPHIKELACLGEKLLHSIDSTAEVIGEYSIEEVALVEPADIDQYEQRLLEAVPLLFKEGNEAEEGEYVELIKLIGDINMQIREYNSLLNKMAGAYEEKLETIKTS